MIVRQIHLGGGFTVRRPPLPVELVRLDRRLSALELSVDPQDAASIAQLPDYLRGLIAEIDRVRPEARLSQPWE